MSLSVKELLEKADAVGAKAESEARDLTETERKEITDLFEKAKAKQADTQLISDLRKFGSDLGEPAEPAEPGTPAAAKGKTIGDRFVGSEAWQDFVKAHPAGFEGKKGLASPPVTYGGMKDLVTGASETSAGALVFADDRGLLDPGAFTRPLTVFDLISRGTTTSDLVEYVRVTTTTNAAAAVPEAETTATVDPDPDNTMGVKPESAIALERVQAPVITIAHWIPATKRSLSDASQVRTLIDTFLSYGLMEAAEDQIVLGAGGDGFTGILNTSGRQVQEWVVTTQFGDDRDILVTTRKARTKVRLVGRARPTAYLFHPNDAERLDLLVDENGNFYFDGPRSDGAQPLWRLPVVESEAVPEGRGIVGDFRQAILWDREAASISVSDSHEDFFTRNLVAILAEMRAAFGVVRPAAFVDIELTAGS